MRTPRRPAPEVHESDYRIPAALGTLAWAVALVVLLALGDSLPESERWWISVCLTGIALGVFGFLYIPRLLRKQNAYENGEQRTEPTARAWKTGEAEKTGQTGKSLRAGPARETAGETTHGGAPTSATGGATGESAGGTAHRATGDTAGGGTGPEHP